MNRSIAIEGADGTGKSRFAKVITSLLRALHQNAYYIALPTQNTFGGYVIENRSGRRISKSALPYLYAADRLEMFQIVRKFLDLSDKNWIVFDRSKYSGIAYGFAFGGDIKWLQAIDMFSPEPELGIYLDRPLNESFEIMSRRLGVSVERAAIDNDLYVQTEIRKVYPELINGLPNWVTYDVSGVVSGDAFKQWEIDKTHGLWNIVCDRLNRPEFIIDNYATMGRYIDWSHGQAFTDVLPDIAEMVNYSYGQF